MHRGLNYYYLKMVVHHIEVPYLGKTRRVRVLLPKDYEKETENRYPVLYMHDGQNVFYSKESYSGHSWKVIPTIKRNKDIPKMIVVGLDNDGDGRMDEYSPWRITNSPLPEDINLGGLGMEYGEWVTYNVKPFIDATYRTLPDKEHTLLAGSSMGGNITAYMGAAYPEVYGNLGVFSLATWITDKQFTSFLNSAKVDPNQKVYIQVGTHEGDDTDRKLMYGNMQQAYIDCSINYTRQLMQMGLNPEKVHLNIFANETHSEQYWAKHFPEFLRFVFDRL